MNCNNCEDIYPQSDMTRWESCPSSIIADADDYYTKHQVDELIEGASGCCITPEEVDEKISAATDGMATEQWVEDQGYLKETDLSAYAKSSAVTQEISSAVSGKADTSYVNDELAKKLDATAYTPTDLSNYYTKSETSGKTEIANALSNKQDQLTAGSGISIVNNVISATGGSEPITIDPTLSSGSSNPVANSAITNALDDKLDVTAYTPVDLSAYATKQWVLNNNYVTNSTLIQYIANLQNQITSLEAAISGCCSSSGTVETRWVTMTGASDYVCSGTTKMSKEQEEQSTDGGVTWTPTGNYRTGSTVLEYNSTDCGYIVPMKFKGVLSSYGGNVNIPCDSSTTLTRSEVYNSKHYKSIEIGNCITTIGDMTFINQIWLDKIIIPSNITTIESEAFADAGNRSSGLTLTFNEGLITIGDNAFFGCRNYSALTIPNSVKTIGTYAFEFNEASIITIGSGVTSIGDYAFARTPSSSAITTSITVLATTPPTISSNGNIFYGIECPIYVPAESVNAYKTANGWSQYSSRIQAIP